LKGTCLEDLKIFLMSQDFFFRTLSFFCEVNNKRQVYKKINCVDKKKKRL
jgi:hypothetical protein